MRPPRRPVAVLSAVALSAAALATAAPATAAGPTAATVPTPVVITVDGPQPGALGDVAGYALGLRPAAPRHKIVASFVVPTVFCQARTSAPLYVDVGLYGTTAGTTSFGHADAVLTIACVAGSQSSTLAVSTGDTQQSVAVEPGEAVTARVASSAQVTIVIATSSRTGADLRVDGDGLLANTAQAAVQGGDGTAAFPRFGATRFLGMHIDNATTAASGATRLDQTTAGGRLLLQATAVNTDGVSFGVRWRGQP